MSVEQKYKQEHVRISSCNEFYPVEPKPDDIGKPDDRDDELDGFNASPETLQIS